MLQFLGFKSEISFFVYIKKMGKRGLIVVTSVEKYPTQNKATGLWLAEVAHLIDVLIPAGWEFDYVSPRGGYTPLDPVSLQMAPNEVDWKWYADAGFRKSIGNTLTPSEIKAENYDLIYFSGGHGVVFDYPDNKQLQEITRTIWEKGGIVSGVCHGVVGLLNVKLSNGDFLLKGRKVTGFSNTEEDEVEATKFVPFLTETELKNRGGVYEKNNQNWGENVVVDGNLITGQNPASTNGIAKAILKIHQ